MSKYKGLMTEKTEKNAPILEQIKSNMLKTSKTTVIIKDSSGEVVTTLTAEPDEDGNLVVQFSSAAKIDVKSG